MIHCVFQLTVSWWLYLVAYGIISQWLVRKVAIHSFGLGFILLDS